MKSIGAALAGALAPRAVQIWPSFRNPAWKLADAAVVLGSRLQASVGPRRVQAKLAPACAVALKDRFLVDDLDRLPMDPMESLYTFQDMKEIATFGDDYRQTRLYRWLQASWLAGRPIEGRGSVFDSEEKIAAYYQTYLDVYRSMKANGYRYEGDDAICLGIGSTGTFFHVRRGTHRLAAAQILGLPSVSVRITHIDRKFALAALNGGAMSEIAALGQAIEKATGQARG